MRILVALTVIAVACGGPKSKKESALVNEGSDTPATCCCKTLPPTAEKEITPVFAMENRMECSTKQGECVDDVQCNASKDADQPASKDGVPPPPPMAPVTTSGPIVP
jgi:hypothetical protein